MDSINSLIRYSFLSGNPENFKEFFEINPTTGAVRQIRAVDTSVTKKFDIIIKVSPFSNLPLTFPIKTASIDNISSLFFLSRKKSVVIR